MSDRQTEAARVARANEQSGALTALEVDGFPVDGPLRFLNGVYARGTADFENYRPAWSKQDSDGFLFFNGADGWVFSDKPPAVVHQYLAAAVPVLDDGTIPIDDKSTSWRIKSGGEVFVQIFGHADMEAAQGVLSVRPEQAEAAAVCLPPIPRDLPESDASIEVERSSEVNLQLKHKDAESVEREQAAARLQAGWRGAVVRKQLNAAQHETATAVADRDTVDADEENQDDDLVEYKYATRLQSCIRGHCLRRRLRWLAEDPESTAPLRAFLGKVGLARLANYFIQRKVQWEQFLTLTPKRLGGHMFPHVDFKFTSPEAAAQFRWKPDNTTGRVTWGLAVDERNRLGKALRAERAKIAGREKASQDTEDAALREAEAAALRKVREKEIVEGKVRAEKQRLHEREETLKQLQWKQRETAAAEQKEAKRKRQILQLQGGIAAQELQRRNAEKARRTAAQEQKDAQQVIERQQARQKAQRTVAMSSLKIDALVRVLPQPQLSLSLSAVGQTGRVNLRSAPAAAPSEVGAGGNMLGVAVSTAAFGLEKLRYADKYGTVEELDRSDDTVLLRMVQNGPGATTRSTRTAAVWFPIECLDTAPSRQYAAERAAAIAKAEQTATKSGLLQLPPLPPPEKKTAGRGARIRESVNRSEATGRARLPIRRHRREATPGARVADDSNHTKLEMRRGQQHVQQQLRAAAGRSPRLQSAERPQSKAYSRRGARAAKHGVPTFTLQGSAASRERVYAQAVKPAMAPRRLPALQLAL
jgi:hypothetical protein